MVHSVNSRSLEENKYARNYYVVLKERRAAPLRPALFAGPRAGLKGLLSECKLVKRQ
jgi:hypothetical protein